MPSTTNYQASDVVLISFPFSAGTRAKNRPALVLLDMGDADLLVARITTQDYRTPFDVRLVHWQKAGLLAPSVVRLHKLATLEKLLASRTLGRLDPADVSEVSRVLRGAFGW